MDIEQLIKKFYDGISTPEEERFLKDFFLCTADIDERWKPDQQLFKALYAEEIPVPPEVSERLEKAIDEMATASRVTVVKRRLLPYWISGAAATILLCMGLFIYTPQDTAPQMADTFEDPAEAALMAEQALAFMSSHLNNGLNQVASAGQEFEKVNRILSKHLK